MPKLLDLYTAVEPNPSSHDTLRKCFDKNVQVAKKFTLEPLDKFGGDLTAAFMSFTLGAGKAAYDWIILGNVLCEVPEKDLPDVIKGLDRALKPGGKVFYSEHTAWDWSTRPFYRLLQELVAPVWLR